MSHTGIAFLAKSWSARKAVLALSVGLGMAALFLFSGIGPLGPAPAAHAALSPPDAQPTAPAAKYGQVPVEDNQQHCHSAEDIGEDQPRYHAHSGFHSGKPNVKGTPADWSAF